LKRKNGWSLSWTASETSKAKKLSASIYANCTIARQTSSLKRLKQEIGDLPKTATGGRHANWICLDYFDVVVHVFYPETRAFYELEDLWSDADVTAYDA
jgi:ribosomal silencing factor RsfS